MSAKNSEQQWGWPSKLMHWLTALLIFIQVPLGFYAHELERSPLKLELFGWHRSLGILILMLVTLRLLWRIAGTVPTSIDASLIQRRLANLAHSLLYGLILVLRLQLRLVLIPLHRCVCGRRYRQAKHHHKWQKQQCKKPMF